MAAPVLLLVTLLTFVILYVLPGNAARQLLGIDATEDQVAQFERELGLDRSPTERYLVWLKRALKGDFGVSIAGRQPVRQLLAERMPVSLELIAYAMILSLGFAIPAALLAARNPSGMADQVVMIFSMVGLSMANYVVAILLVLVFSVKLGLLPSMGYVPLRDGVVGNIRSLTLPAVAMAIPLFCLYTRFLRGDMLEKIQHEEYVCTAIAKGLGPWTVLIRHVLRNSIVGLLTLVGMNVSVLIGGSVIIEQIFAVPGIGQLLLHAIGNRDVQVVQAITVVIAASALLSIYPLIWLRQL